MDWVSANWFWILIAIAFVAMHLFGHGSHGRHGGCGHGSHGRDDPQSNRDPSQKREEEQPGGHRH